MAEDQQKKEEPTETNAEDVAVAEEETTAADEATETMDVAETSGDGDGEAVNPPTDVPTPDAESEPLASAEGASLADAEVPGTEEIAEGEKVKAAEGTPEDAAATDEAAATDTEAGEPSEPIEPGDLSSIMEEAVSDAIEDMAIPSASAAGVKAVPDDEIETSVDSRQDLEMKTVGYTGEIIGSVVKLEDLIDESDETEDERANYDQLRQLIETTLTDVSENEIVSGRVVSVGEKDVVIDIGFKSDGVVSKSEFDRELNPGDEVEVFLEYLEDYHGQLVLSKTKADTVRRWQRIEDAFENEEVIEGTIVRRIKGGMIVELDIGGVEAFLPGSQIDVRPVRDFDAYLEKRMEYKIVKLNPANENIVVSHKALIEKELQAQREKILSTMEPGQVLEGTVKNITDFGVFIDLGGVDGLLHITDLSWGRVSHPSELVDLDEKMNVVVLDYDKERQRISLGLKQLQPHPWENMKDKYSQGETVEGKVVSITDYGAFVELEKGIEGLVHISEMSWTEHIKHPSQKVALGQIVPVKILNIDHEGKKISLGMKQLEPDPWDSISDRYPPGTVLRGKVRNITNFGVFVEIEPGIDGLVHISDLSWTRKIKHPGEVAKKGQEMDVVILNIDEKERRISLGHKQIQTNPWSDLANAYSEGTDHTVKVVNVQDNGLVVELPLEVEAFVPANQLKNGPRNFQEFYHEGDELNLRVIRFDQNQKEIVMSETAKEQAAESAARAAEVRERRDEEREIQREVKSYSQKTAATGPTTLGELSGLEELKAQLEAQEAEAEEAEAEAAEAEAEEAEAKAEETEAKAEEAKAEETEAKAEEAEAEASEEAEAESDEDEDKVS